MVICSILEFNENRKFLLEFRLRVQKINDLSQRAFSRVTLRIILIFKGGSCAAECIQGCARLIYSIPKLFEDTRLVSRCSVPEDSEDIAGSVIRIVATVIQLLSKFSAPIRQILLDEGMDSGDYPQILRPDLQVTIV